MKKIGLALLVLVVIFAAIFLWLLGKSSPENANTEPVTIEVQDNFEK